MVQFVVHKLITNEVTESVLLTCVIYSSVVAFLKPLLYLKEAPQLQIPKMLSSVQHYLLDTMNTSLRINYSLKHFEASFLRLRVRLNSKVSLMVQVVSSFVFSTTWSFRTDQLWDHHRMLSLLVSPVHYLFETILNMCYCPIRTFDKFFVGQYTFSHHQHVWKRDDEMKT